MSPGEIARKALREQRALTILAALIAGNSPRPLKQLMIDAYNIVDLFEQTTKDLDVHPHRQQGNLNQ